MGFAFFLFLVLVVCWSICVALKVLTWIVNFGWTLDIQHGFLCFLVLVWFLILSGRCVA